MTSIKFLTQSHLACKEEWSMIGYICCSFFYKLCEFHFFVTHFHESNILTSPLQQVCYRFLVSGKDTAHELARRRAVLQSCAIPCSPFLFISFIRLVMHCLYIFGTQFSLVLPKNFCSLVDSPCPLLPRLQGAGSFFERLSL